MVDLELLPGE